MSRYVDGERGHALDNALALSDKQLKQRETVHVDIANDALHNPKEYSESEDPLIFISEKTGRGPLGPQWTTNSNPVMTIYKSVSVEFKWFGLQNAIENLLQNYFHGLFHRFHRQAFCWIDKWHGMSLSNVRQLERQVKLELDKKRADIVVTDSPIEPSVENVVSENHNSDKQLAQ